MTHGARIYNLFPPLAGSIDRWIVHLPRIAAMHFDWVYINPFHETGYSGSFYAVKDFYRMNPLFRGPAPTSDDEQLRSFIDRAAASDVRVMMDLVINHTARDADLITTHPEWFHRDWNGEIISPSASDPANPADVTVWTDLAELDYTDRPDRAAMIAYFSAVIAHYLGLGVRGFRCDAAYKLPADVWAALIAGARRIAPDVVFAAENLGAPEEAVLALRPAGFDLLFNSAKWWDFHSPWLLDQYDRFRRIAPSIAFPESHDTPRLVAELDVADAALVEAQYRLRYLFAAFFSSSVMLPMGYEFGFKRQVDVVLTRPEQWETPVFDLTPFITAVNAMKMATPALNEEGPQRALSTAGATYGLVRTTENGASTALALINATATPSAPIDIVAQLHPPLGATLEEITPGERSEIGHAVALAPYEMRVFATPADRLAPGGDGAKIKKSAPKACVIEAITPQIDGGRHPVKRIVGDRVVVEADIFREGHDALAAVLRYRANDGDWFETPMRLVDNDRWAGSFSVETVGRAAYLIDAWPDTFATWSHDTAIKHAAGVPVGLEIIEGRALVAATVKRAPKGDRPTIEALLTAFDALDDDRAKLALLLSDGVERVMEHWPDRSLATRSTPELSIIVDRRVAEIAAWYEFFPRSQAAAPGMHGTFADAERQLPRIRDLGFDVVYLPPIHPIGVAHRKGRNNSLDPAPDDPGSPWAIGNAAGGHRAVEPKLGTLADFDHFVTTATDHGLAVAIDYALQCSPDHPYVREHPEWFAFRPDGSIKYAENPPKKYQDIVNFNWYGPQAPALWKELRDVVLFWIGHGVTMFRVDNPHTKPFDFWEWMIGDVQERHPGVIFLAEAFTRPKVMHELAKVGFSQSYTYFTWRNDKHELIAYVTELAAAPSAEYYRPNFFANTPDILPPFLQSGGRAAFLIRLYLAATLSSLYGIYSGFEICENAALPGREEYADSEKYQLTFRDWNAPGNINADIRLVNRIRRENRALDDWRSIRFLNVQNDNVLYFMKTTGSNTLLIAVNLDPVRATEAWLELPLADIGLRDDEPFLCENLVTGEHLTWRGGWASVYLDPLQQPAAILRIDGHTHV